MQSRWSNFLYSCKILPDLTITLDSYKLYFNKLAKIIMLAWICNDSSWNNIAMIAHCLEVGDRMISFFSEVWGSQHTLACIIFGFTLGNRVQIVPGAWLVSWERELMPLIGLFQKKTSRMPGKCCIFAYRWLLSDW